MSKPPIISPEKAALLPIAMSPDRVADELGIDRSTFYRRVMPAVYSGEIASLKIGAARRILTASLAEWAARHAQDEG